MKLPHVLHFATGDNNFLSRPLRGTTHPAKQRELVTILAVRLQILRLGFQYTAHRRPGEVRHRAIDGQPAEKYILGLGLYEYRVRIVEDAVDRLTYDMKRQNLYLHYKIAQDNAHFRIRDLPYRLAI